MADLGAGLRLHYVEAGDPAGSLVVLLHGFPQFWYCWHKQIPALAAAGYRVVAFDMRGYNLSSKPAPIKEYEIENLAGDVQRMITFLGAEKAAAVVGHDWGAAVAWQFAQSYPEMYERLCIMNVPHPAEFTKGLQTPTQLAKSWYIGAFQVPGVPEAVFAAANWQVLRTVFERDPEPPFSAEEIEEHVAAFRDNPGAMTAAINYYRAAGQRAVAGALAPKEEGRSNRAVFDLPFENVISAPVLVLWGEKDAYLGKEMAVPPSEWVPNARTKFFANSTHWVNHDVAEEVNAELLQFLAE